MSVCRQEQQQQQTVSQELRSPSDSFGDCEWGKLRPIREKSEGGIRHELGNGTLGMFNLIQTVLL